MDFYDTGCGESNSERLYNPRLGIVPGRYDEDEDQNLDTFCAVCGVPLRVMEEVLQLEKDKEKYKWLKDGICIRPSSLEQLGTSWETNRFHGYGKPLEVLPINIENHFVFYQWRESYDPVKTRFIFENWNPFPWIGIHKKCFDLMKRLVEYRTSVLDLAPDDSSSIPRSRYECSTHVPASLGEMYEVYQSRIYNMPELTFTWREGHRCVWKVLEPHLYYYDEEALYDNEGGLFSVHNSYHARDGNLHDDRPMALFKLLEWPFGSPDVDQYEAAPFPIGDLMPRILSYLQQLPAESTIIAPALQSKLNRLPVEIQERIYQELHPFTDPTIECTRHLAHAVWKTLLFEGQILPWIWESNQFESTVPDGDETLITSMEGMTINDRNGLNSEEKEFWDWELLVRQLAQYDAFEPGTIMQDMPWALWNRRRIWRLLDEARRDDVDPEEFRQYRFAQI